MFSMLNIKYASRENSARYKLQETRHEIYILSFTCSSVFNFDYFTLIRYFNFYLYMCVKYLLQNGTWMSMRKVSLILVLDKQNKYLNEFDLSVLYPDCICSDEQLIAKNSFNSLLENKFINFHFLINFQMITSNTSITHSLFRDLSKVW